MRKKIDAMALVVFLSALSVRAAMVWFVVSQGNLQTWEYETIADNILNGLGYSIKYLGVTHYSFGPPVYPFFSVAVYWLTNHSHLALALAQAFFSALTCVIVYKIGKMIFGRSAGLLAGFLCALHPGLIVYVGKLHSFNIDTFLLVLVVFALLKANQKMTWQRFLFLGVVSGLCMLSRSTIFLFLPFAFGYLWMRSVDKKRVLRGALLCCIGIFLIVGSWIFRNYLVLNKFVFIQESGEVFWRGNNPNATGTAYALNGTSVVDTMPGEMSRKLQNVSGIEQDQIFWKESLHYVASNPMRSIALTTKKFYYFWWFSPHSGKEYPHFYLILYRMLYAFILFFACAGIISGLYSKTQAVNDYTCILLLFFLIISVSQSLFYVEGRHRWGIEPLLLLVTSQGFFSLLPYGSRFLGRFGVVFKHNKE